MRTAVLIAMAIAALGAVEPAAAQGHKGGPPILGYRVVLKAEGGDRTKGELIAVSPDSLWLLRENALTVYPLANLAQVDIQESSFGAGKAFLWSVLAGAISGAALTAACSSVSDDCRGIFPAVFLSWSLIGGIGALAVEPARYNEIRAPGADQLRPYSRFPQGIPDEFGSEGRRPLTSSGSQDGRGR